MISKTFIIVGMHRSGTSALTGFLSFLGGSLPKNLMVEVDGNPLGHFESLDFCRINEKFLTKYSSSWFDWSSELSFEDNCNLHLALVSSLEGAIASEFKDLDLPLIKDPRVCNLLPFYYTAINNLGYDAYTIVPVRQPMEVAKSLRKRDDINIVDGLSLWLHHVLNAEFYSRGKIRVFTSYNELLDNYRKMVKKIEAKLKFQFPNNIDDVSAQVDAFLSPKYKNNYADDIPHMGCISHWVTTVYDILSSWIDGVDESAADYNQLDLIRIEFRRIALAYGPLIRQLSSGFKCTENQLGTTKAALKVKTSELDTTKAALNLKTSELDTTKAALNVKTSELDTTKAALSVKASELDVMKVELTSKLELVLSEYDKVSKYKCMRDNKLLSCINALLLFPQLIKHYRLLKRTQLFDSNWYRQKYPDVNKNFKYRLFPQLHYLKYGHIELRDPGPEFSSHAYLKQNFDVRVNGSNPLVHYVIHGFSEGRCLST